jgi:hypothetical protein
MFIPYIKGTFVKKDYKEILKNTAGKRCRPNNIILDLFGGYAYTHLSKNKELTLSTYDGFIKFCKKYNVMIKDNNMCLACRLLFEHYGWLEKIDAHYEIPTYENGKKEEGKAMAYTLTEQFPFYKEYEELVGKKNIGKVRTKGMASLIDFESMNKTA